MHFLFTLVYMILTLSDKSCLYTPIIIDSLPDDKILDRSKIKQIADDILNCI